MNHRMGIFMGHRRAKGLLAHPRNNGGVESKNPTPLPPFPSGHKESRPQPRNIEADLSEGSVGKGQTPPHCILNEGLEADKLPKKNRVGQYFIPSLSSFMKGEP